MLYEQYFIDGLKNRAVLVRRSFVIVTFVVSLMLSAVAQEQVEAILVDEFGITIRCGDLLARTDAFAVDIQQQPSSKAFILFEHSDAQARLRDRIGQLISSTLQLRGIETDQFVLMSAKSTKGRVSYWIAPTGAEIPVDGAAKIPEPEIDLSKPFAFGYADELDICPTFVPKTFARLILDNPGSRGHIVIVSAPRSGVNKYYFAEMWIKEIVEKHGVPRNRLRLFFSNSNSKSSQLTSAQFWFVPAKRK